MKSLYKRLVNIGPGGRKCNCCFPPPGKTRKKEDKSGVKRLFVFLDKEIEKELTTKGE